MGEEGVVEGAREQGRDERTNELPPLIHRTRQLEPNLIARRIIPLLLALPLPPFIPRRRLATRQRRRRRRGRHKPGRIGPSTALARVGPAHGARGGELAEGAAEVGFGGADGVDARVAEGAGGGGDMRHALGARYVGVGVGVVVVLSVL